MNSDARSPLPATRYSLPALGQNPSSARQGTTPGSFANPPQIGGPRTFSSPDTPGMPAPSDKTAWDFVPVRDEVAAGRMVIPANINHLKHKLDPMAIGRASKTKVNANMGASPGLQRHRRRSREAQVGREVGRGHGDGPLDRRRPRRHPRGDHPNATVPIGTVPIYSMIIGKKIEDLDWPTIEALAAHRRKQGVDYFTIHAGVRRAHLKHVKNRLIGIVSAAARSSPSGCSSTTRRTSCTRAGRTSATSSASTTSRSRSATACAPAAWPMRPTRRRSPNSKPSANSPNAPGARACRS
jgi:phosphomethylpyrimidine synthase